MSSLKSNKAFSLCTDYINHFCSVQLPWQRTIFMGRESYRRQKGQCGATLWTGWSFFSLICPKNQGIPFINGGSHLEEELYHMLWSSRAWPQRNIPTNHIWQRVSNCWELPNSLCWAQGVAHANPLLQLVNNQLCHTKCWNQSSLNKLCTPWGWQEGNFVQALGEHWAEGGHEKGLVPVTGFSSASCKEIHSPRQ